MNMHPSMFWVTGINSHIAIKLLFLLLLTITIIKAQLAWNVFDLWISEAPLLL